MFCFGKQKDGNILEGVEFQQLSQCKWCGVPCLTRRDTTRRDSLLLGQFGGSNFEVINLFLLYLAAPFVMWRPFVRQLSAVRVNSHRYFGAFTVVLRLT